MNTPEQEIKKNAPEGATHYRPERAGIDNERGFLYYKYVDGVLYGYCFGEWSRSCMGKITQSMYIKPL